jgi:hypothetical protein
MLKISEDAVPVETTSRALEEQDGVTSAPVPDTLDGEDGLTDPMSSVGILSSSGESELSYAGTFTQMLISAMDESGGSLDGAMDTLSGQSLKAEGSIDEGAPSQTATIARLGKGSTDDAGQKKAVVIGNKSYQSMDGTDSYFLDSSEQDAVSMAGALQSSDHSTDLHIDQNAGNMEALYREAVTDSALVPGDAVTLYFSGHGTPLGPVGTGAMYQGFHHVADPAIYRAGPIPNDDPDFADTGKDIKRKKLDFDAALDAPTEKELEISDIMPNSVFTSLVGEATGRGLHLRIILDACFSGQSTDTVRDELVSKVAEGSTDPTLTAGVACAQALDGWKEKISAWRRKLTVNKDGEEDWWVTDAQPAIVALLNEFSALTGEALTPPAASLDPIAQIAEIHSMIDQAINAMIAKLQKMVDGEED